MERGPKNKKRIFVCVHRGSRLEELKRTCNVSENFKDYGSDVRSGYISARHPYPTSGLTILFGNPIRLHVGPNS